MSAAIIDMKKKIESSNTFSKQLRTEDFLYHSIGGFDLFKLITILNHGILSLNRSKQYGIRIGSLGQGENRTSSVSVSTYEVLSCNEYAGTNISIIINPVDLQILNPSDYPSPYTINDGFIISNLTTSQMLAIPDRTNCPSHERQINGEVSVKNIVAIMIPQQLLSCKLENIPILNLDHFNLKLFCINFLNLEKFFKANGLPSMFQDKAIDEAFSILLSFKDVKYSIKNQKAKIDSAHKFNKEIMRFILKEYRTLLNRTDICLLDIMEYHLKNKYPIYQWH